LADFRIGTLIRLGELTCQVAGTDHHGATVVVIAEDGSERSISISRAELCARLCDDTARVVDPIARPDLVESTPPVTLAFLSNAARIDWYHRMILLRGLMHVSTCSPRSATYQRAFSEATRLLEWVRTQSCLPSGKAWTAKRTNDVLRNWRHHGGAIAALLVQFVPARRRKPTNATTKAFRDLVHSTTKRLPYVSTATINRVAGAAMRARGVGSDAGAALCTPKRFSTTLHSGSNLTRTANHGG
jgi:hypothetical protein